LTILSCDVTLCDDTVPFGGVSSGVLAVHGPLKKALMRDRTLFDIEEKQALAYVSPDTPISSSSHLVWCLLVGGESNEDWEVETLTSQTSQDYPEHLSALLLMEERSVPKRTFRRVGIVDSFFETSLHWFEGCATELIDII
jgi:hypothetical protein